MKMFNYEEINAIYELSGNQWQCVLAGGVAIILGVYTSVAALIQVLVMVVATWVSIWKHREPFLSTPEGKGWDVNFLLIGALFALLFLGSGQWSLIGR